MFSPLFSPNPILKRDVRCCRTSSTLHAATAGCLTTRLRRLRSSPLFPSESHLSSSSTAFACSFRYYMRIAGHAPKWLAFNPAVTGVRQGKRACGVGLRLNAFSQEHSFCPSPMCSFRLSIKSQLRHTAYRDHTHNARTQFFSAPSPSLSISLFSAVNLLFLLLSPASPRHIARNSLLKQLLVRPLVGSASESSKEKAAKSGKSKSLDGQRDDNAHKFGECAVRVIYYAPMFFVALYLADLEDYWPNLDNCWKDARNG